MSLPTLLVPSPRTIRQHFGAFTALALLALFVDYADGPPRHQSRHAEPRQPPLEAKTGFFSNTVLAIAHVGSFGLPFHGPGDAPDREGTPSGRPPAGGMGGMGHSPGGGGGLRGPGGHREASAGESRPAQRSMGAAPRQTLRITFTNTGTEPVEFTITELRSAIGNFAPQPDRLQLAPGAKATIDPVRGDAGDALAWLDVTLSLRHAGATETRVLHLTRVIATDSPPAQ